MKNHEKSKIREYSFKNMEKNVKTHEKSKNPEKQFKKQAQSYHRALMQKLLTGKKRVKI